MSGAQRLPTEVPREWAPGQMLYNRQRMPLDPFWSELPPRMREAWAACERHLGFVVRRIEDPPQPASETTIERYERHVAAVSAVLDRCLAELGGYEQNTDEEPLRRFAEDALAAAHAGF